MSITNGYNILSGIPGYDATKGERIVKALQKLWAKIEHLEQLRISEKKSHHSTSDAEDLTITDVQYKMLVIQLQYVRSIIRKKQKENAGISIANKNLNEIDGDSDAVNHAGNFKHSIPEVSSQETQTGNSLIEVNYNTDDQESKENDVFSDENEPDHMPSQNTRPLHTHSKPHYHLKLDDVPFILGASSSASHSVVANVQNIIAMMKNHNKALCGPKHNIQQRSTSKLHSTGLESDDTSKMMSKLAQDLQDLAHKQETLVKRFDSAQAKSTSQLAVNKSDRTKLTTNEGSRKINSNAETAKLKAQVTGCSSLRDREQRVVAFNSRNHSGNVPIMARRKFLRSLQTFKSHLSEEDITWE